VTSDLVARAAVIASEHAAAQAGARATLAHARRAGEELIAVKAAVPYGQWLSWLDVNVPGLSQRVAQLYMSIARRWDELAVSNPKRGSDLSLRASLRLLRSPREPLPLAPGGCEGDDEPEPVAEEPVPDAQTRMVRLFLDAAADAEFREQERALRAAYGTDTVTDTVTRAVANEHEARCGRRIARVAGGAR
jgi:hypothetical protein